jgi:Kef-type K+ transport system membrane component KefB
VPSPSLSAAQLLVFLGQLAGLLVLATVAGRLSARVGLPTVTGELLVGVLLGPTVLGRLPDQFGSWLPGRDPHQQVLLDVVGQLGVLLLVGLTGAGLDLKRVRARGTAAARVSAGGLLVPLTFGVLLGFVLPGSLFAGDRVTFALLLGVALAVSAIPVIARILADLRLVNRNVGQLILTASVVDDAVGWLLLSTVSAMATGGALLWVVASSLVLLVLSVIFTLTIGRTLMSALLRRASGGAEPTPVIATVVIVMLLCAGGASVLGFEPVFGAFLGGIMVGSARVLPERALDPLRTVVLSVLAPVFFAMAGLRMDLTLLARPAVLLAGLAVLAVAILGKVGGAYLGARLSRIGHWEALAIGVGLNARGVIEVIVATIGVQIGVLSTAGYTIIVLVAVVTSVLAPPLLRLAMTRVERTADERLAAHEHGATDVANS